jgi:hypothetical protein
LILAVRFLEELFCPFLRRGEIAGEEVENVLCVKVRIPDLQMRQPREDPHLRSIRLHHRARRILARRSPESVEPSCHHQTDS